MSDTVLTVLDHGGIRQADPSIPLVRADDLAVLRGEAVFETLRTAAGRAFQLPEHLARMRVSAARIDLRVPPVEVWHRLVEASLRAFGPAEGQLRLIHTKGPADGEGVSFALHSAVPPSYADARARGIEAVTLTLGVPAGLRATAPWLLGGVKATSYAVAMAGLRSAADVGAADAIWISTDGEVLEAPTSTVVIIEDGLLVTPPALEVAVLPGTTVRALAALAGGIVERRITVAALRGADEAMLVSSVRGVAPLVALDGVAIGTGEVGLLTASVRDALEEAVMSGRELP